MGIGSRVKCLVGVVSLSGLLFGCSTNYISQPSSELKVKTVGTLKPDIEVGEKIEATASVSRICYMFISGPGKFAEGINYGDSHAGGLVEDSFWGDTIAQAKAAAAYRACVESKADFIICPRYYIMVDSYPFYKQVKANVFGYKGVLKNVRLPEPEKPVIQPVQIMNPLKIAEPVEIAQPLKLSQPIQVSPSPIQLIQPIEVTTKAPVADTAVAKQQVN